MTDPQSKPKFYPLKPKNAEGFKKAVAWFGGRELVASLKGVIMYAIYGENMDPRSWMKPNIYPNIGEKIRFQKEDEVKNKIKAEVENEIADHQVLNATVETAAKEEIKNDAAIQTEITRNVSGEWAKKAFDYWEWKREHFGFWEEYLETKSFWKNLKVDNEQTGTTKERQIEEFWFDFISDSGDGQMGVFGVGCMCFSDLWLTAETVGSEIKFEPPEKPDWEKQALLPRGYFLFVGGDTAYHTANYATLFERFQTPFRWAFTSVRKFLFEKYQPKLKPEESFFLSEGKPVPVFDAAKQPVENWDGTLYAEINKKLYWDSEPPRPFFGIPANHDYYDSIDGFNRQFRRSPFEGVEENMIYEGNKGKVALQIPSFSREQEASYIAIHLPFDWWMFGIDSENEKLDFRQEVFFKQIVEKRPKKLILATPEPTTVFGKKSLPAEKTTTYLKAITESLNFEQPYLTDGKLTGINGSKTADAEGFCRLDLSGDVHHYARYWGENTRGFENERFSSSNYASLVSGGGGAFFDTTSTLLGSAFGADGKILKDGAGEETCGEVPPQKLYPSESESINCTADKIFDLWNIRKGGYIQFAGAIFSVIIFFFLIHFSYISESFQTSPLAKPRGAAAAFSQNPDQLTIPAATPEISTAATFLSPNISGFITQSRIYFALFILLAVMTLTQIGARKLYGLIKDLKQKSFDETVDKNVEDELIQLARISQLLKVVLPYLASAAALYAFFILLNIRHSDDEIKILSFEESLKNLFLLFHVVIAVLLIWLSFDYTNWLAVRFKVKRKSSQKTLTEQFEDPNEKAEGRFSFVLKYLGTLSREYSYAYFPVLLLVCLAGGALIFGVGIFGDAELGRTLADSILIVVVLGLFLLVVYLAYGTGAAYQNQTGKNKFLIIGLWHAALQILAPFVLFYYAHWAVVLGVFLLVFLFNGFSRSAHRINSLLSEAENNDERDWRKTLKRIVNFRLGAWIMKRGNRRLLAASWVIYGLIVLLTPFAVLSLFPGSESLNQTIYRVSSKIFNYFTNSPDPKFIEWLSIALSIFIVALIGYRLSRVWFSWYLGVSVLYNGHNNEAGGMARIEDFKQILRIKVEEKKLTVFVIGMDAAHAHLDEKLKLRLVDKFELKCSEAT